MKKQIKKLALIGCVFTLVLTACKKESVVEEQIQVRGNGNQSLSILPLAKGNYWVYTYKSVDTNGNTMSTSQGDSIWIDSGIYLNGHHYFETFSHPRGPIFPRYLREDDQGNILELIPDSTDRCKTTIFKGHDEVYIPHDYQMQTNYSFFDWDISQKYQYKYDMIPVFNLTEANNITYSTVNKKMTIEALVDPWLYYGNFRETDKQFAEGIGLVRQSYFYIVSENTSIQELIRYNIN